MKRFAFMLVAALMATFAKADDVTMTKCYGNSAVQGYGASSGTSISAAALFNVSETAPFAGGQLTSVRMYLSATNMTSFEAWVKNNVTDTKKLASVKVDKPVVGWNTVTFDTPVDISGSEPITLGYTYTQTTANPCYALTFAEEMVADGLYLAIGNTFQDCSFDYGALSIEGTVTGVTIDAYGAELRDIALASSFVATSTEAEAEVTIHNTGKAFSSITVRTECGGKTLDNKVSATVPFNGLRTATVKFPTPDAIGFNAAMTATVVAIDDEPYESEAVTATFDAYSKLYDRNVVIEEGTGTWCGWCVRGIVAMEQMNEKYPDTFIGIAAHTSSTTTDPMNIAGYASSLGITGFPGCTVDRVPSMKGVNVHPLAFEQYYQIERRRRTYADFTFDAWISAIGKIDGATTATFDFDKASADIRMVYVLIEDGLTGYRQTNYYAGGGQGVMGGFESKPSTVTDIVFNDVARKVYPSVKGTKNSLTADVVKGQEYLHEFSYTMPTVKNKENLSLVALMINGTNGEIIQAHKKKLVRKTEEIDAVTATHAATRLRRNIYTPSGQRLNTPRKGLNIVDGRKVIVK